MAMPLLCLNGTISFIAKKKSLGGKIFEGKPQHFRNQNLGSLGRRSVSMCHPRASPLAGRCKTYLCIYPYLHSLKHRSRARIHWGWETVQPNRLTYFWGESSVPRGIICEWEEKQKLGNPGLHLYPCFHICIYKNMYTHRGKTKQNSPLHTVLPRGEGERANKWQMWSVSPRPALQEDQLPQGQGGLGSHQSRKQQETPRQEKTTRQRGPGSAGTLSSLGITTR